MKQELMGGKAKVYLGWGGLRLLSLLLNPLLYILCQLVNYLRSFAMIWME